MQQFANGRIHTEQLLRIFPRYYRPQRSCGQGYVFTRVCDSVNTPRRRLLLRTVRILLECILVPLCDATLRWI